MLSTKIITINPLNPDDKLINQAAGVVKKGGLVIIPTETVYGIAANGRNDKAVERLYEIKSRPKDKPFSIVIHHRELVEELARDIPIAAYKLIDKFWPGALTLILKSRVTGNVGVRMPDDEIALRIIEASRVPIVCPSANISGMSAPVSFAEAIKDLQGKVDLAIDSGNTRLGQESTIADLSTESLSIIREGAIKKEEIELVARRKIVLFICTGNSCRSVMAEAFLRKKIKEQGRENEVEVLSRGLMSLPGLGATGQTRELLMQEGIDVSGHFSRKVSADVVKKSDIILVMEPMHEENILRMFPMAKNRVFLLKEFAKIKDNNLGISDPIGNSMEFYTRTFAVIKEAVEKVASII